MYSTMHTQIMKARTGDLHHQARQDGLARAAKRDRRALRAHGTSRVLPSLRPWPVMHRPAI